MNRFAPQSAKTLVVITGADGVGKSTTTALLNSMLSREFGEGFVRQVTIWDSLDHAPDPSERLGIERHISRLSDAARRKLLRDKLSKALVKAYASSASLLLMEGYWYKYAVAEQVYGACPDLIDDLADLFPTPDLTVRLTLATPESARRKVHISPYEQGLREESSDLAGGEVGRFIQFQDRAQRYWNLLDAQFGPWAQTSTNEAPEIVARHLLALMRAQRLIPSTAAKRARA